MSAAPCSICGLGAVGVRPEPDHLPLANRGGMLFLCADCARPLPEMVRAAARRVRLLERARDPGALRAARRTLRILRQREALSQPGP